MKKRYLVPVLVVAGILISSYAVYAVEYKGNYNLQVSFDVMVGSSLEIVQIANVNHTEVPTEYVDFWDLLKHITPASKELMIYFVKMNVMVDGESIAYESYWWYQRVSTVTHQDFNIYNIAPGEATLEIDVYKVSEYTGLQELILEYSEEIEIGGMFTWA